MAPDHVRDTLQDILTQHGLECVVEREWVVPRAELPAIRALWNEGERSGRLDVQVLVSQGVLIDECFAGLGAGEQGFNDALQNFMANSLHVLLAALWGVNEPDQMTVEHWNVSGKDYVAYIGNIGTRGATGATVQPPAQLFREIEKRVKAEPLTKDLHWVRTFFASVSGSPTFEALLDNEPWEGGVEALKGITWPDAPGYYSFRNFLVLRAA